MVGTAEAVCPQNKAAFEKYKFIQKNNCTSRERHEQ
jgi:hypothetical protein